MARRPAWPDRFLEALKTKGSIAAAAKEVKVGRSTVYEEFKRNPDFKADCDRILEECVELVEATLYQQALNPDATTDRIFFLKTRKPEVYGDKLRQDQIDKIKTEARAGLMLELRTEIALLPEAERVAVMRALLKARGELTA